MPYRGRFQFGVVIGAFVAVAVAVAFIAGPPAGPTPIRAHSGQYLYFPGPGPGSVQVAHDPALTPGAAMTVEAWVYLSSYQGWYTTCPTVAGKGFQTSYWLGICDGRIRFYPNGLQFTGPGTVPLNEWVHVAATYDGTTVRTYINGVLDGQGDVAGGIGANSEPFGIGSDAHWDASPAGAIDEVRLWSVARSQAEIAASMNTTISSPQAGLVAAFNFDSGPDADVGGFSGSLTGNAVITSGEVPTPVPTETPPPTSPAPAKGDINCDGSINGLDVLLLLQEVAGTEPELPGGCAPIGS